MQPKNPPAAEAGEAFWRFSLALYARPGVAPALIALQDRAGHDVNLILFCLWAGAVRGLRLDTAMLATAETAVADLRRELVEPLRALRRRLKADPAADVQALRRQVLVLELVAERRVQYRLAAQTVPAAAAEPIAAANANLALYLGPETKSAEAEIVRAALGALARHQ